jgi:hypothetical protein
MRPFPEGFAGGAPFSALPESDVPREPGVYVVVLSERAGRPAFLPASPAGRFKGKDPSVPLSRLEAKWVDGTEVVYIGKAAGGRGGGRGLRKRLDEYRRFGAGEPAPHWGGRLVWQLASSGELLVWWRPVADPEGEERRMLAEFHAEHGGRLPFANLRG